MFLFYVSSLYQAIKPMLSTRIVLVLPALYSSSISNFLPLVHFHYQIDLFTVVMRSVPIDYDIEIPPQYS
jgi:hypothetical protein